MWLISMENKVKLFVLTRTNLKINEPPSVENHSSSGATRSQDS